MIMIKKLTQEDVEACSFKPEPHTVSLRENGEWWGLVKDEKILSVCCVSNRHGGKYFSQTFTPMEERRKGYCSRLLYFLANHIYYQHKCIAHCLKKSVNCYMRAGFRFVKLRKFKYGDQYYMEKDAKG